MRKKFLMPVIGSQPIIEGKALDKSRNCPRKSVSSGGKGYFAAEVHNDGSKVPIYTYIYIYIT